MTEIKNHHWGIDLGGTKIEGVILNADNLPEVVDRVRIPTEREKGYEHILGRINEVIEILKKNTGLAPASLGIGTPGKLDPRTGLLKNSNTTCLTDQPVKSDLEDLLDIPVEIANDANCFALAEATLGIVRQKNIDAQVVFGIILGTGVGGGVVINGKILNGTQGLAGEWGHNFLDESGGPCYCGHSGCVETVISGTGLEKYYRELTGQNLNLKEIVDRHKKGTDKAATDTINRLCHYFGKAISVVIDIIDPDVVVVGGGVGNIDELYTAGFDSAKSFVFNDGLTTTFLKPALGDSAGVFGAAMLVSGE
jgi:predicted NBD/HSP70 family sugar kinase